MTDTTGWPGEPGVPLNPERNAFHWLRRKGAQWHEAWAWDADADGCGTEYSGAWAETDGDGVPIEMARWYEYLGPCLTPAEVSALIEEARREEREAILEMIEGRESDWMRCNDIYSRYREYECGEIIDSIRARGAV